MTWSVLQSKEAKGAGANPVVTMTNNVVAGSKLIACASGASNLITAVADNNSNAFTRIVRIVAGAGGETTDIWVLDTPAGDVGTKPTITATVAGSFYSLLVQEVSGLFAGAACLDGTAGTSSATSPTPVDPVYSSTAANEYLISIFGAGFGSGNMTWTAPGGSYTTDPSSRNTDASIVQGVAYKNSTGGSESAGWAVNENVIWTEVLVAFKLPPAAGPAAPPAGGGKSMLARSMRWADL